MATKKTATATTATPAAAGVPTYILSPKAAALAAAGATGAVNLTLQNAKSGLGKAWHTTATAKPNTRAMALAAIAALPQPFTLVQAQQALAALHAAGTLGSGTPRSYCVAFVGNGYFAESK